MAKGGQSPDQRALRQARANARAIARGEQHLDKNIIRAHQRAAHKLDQRAAGRHYRQHKDEMDWPEGQDKDFWDGYSEE